MAGSIPAGVTMIILWAQLVVWKLWSMGVVAWPTPGKSPPKKIIYKFITHGPFCRAELFIINNTVSWPLILSTSLLPARRDGTDSEYISPITSSITSFFLFFMESLKIKNYKVFFYNLFPVLLLISRFVTHFPFSIKIKKLMV